MNIASPRLILGCCGVLQDATGEPMRLSSIDSVGQDAWQTQPRLPCRPLSNPSLPCSKSCWLEIKGQDSFSDVVHCSCSPLGNPGLAHSWCRCQADVQIQACVPLLAAAVDVELAHLPQQRRCCQEHLICCCQVLLTVL